MDRTEKFEYWLEIAEYDLGAADAMYQSARWLYVVFMCQQAIEKMVKGLYILYIDDNVPRIHNISQIINKYANKLDDGVSEDYYTLFDDLTSFYIEGRYPEYKDMLHKTMSKKESESILNKTKEVFAWLLTMKPR